MDKKTTWKIVAAVVLIDLMIIPPVIWYALRNQGDAGEAGRGGSPAPALQKLYPVPEFSFTDQDGAPITKANLLGKAWVAYVFFSTCAGPCPVMNANVAELAKGFEPDAGVRFVGFTVDPQVDTPAVLKAYGERYDADFREWHLVTGESEKLQALARDGFKLGSGDSALIHSEYLVLIDKTGTVRGYFTGTDAAVLPEVTTALRQLAAE